MRDAAVDPNRLGRPAAFWVGVGLITVGAGLVLAGFLAQRDAPGAAYALTPGMVLGLVTRE